MDCFKNYLLTTKTFFYNHVIKKVMNRKANI